MPNIEVAPPKYLQIAQHLREQIIRGDLAPGAEVPSERQLATEWNVSRPTATRALEALRREGMVTSVVGSGTVVRDVQAHRRPLHRYNRFRQRGAQYGPGESVEIVAADVRTAPDYVAEALRIAAGEQAMMRRRVITSATGNRVEIATSWWPTQLADVAPRLLIAETLGGIGSVRYVESVTGRQAGYARDRVTARLATDQEAVELRLDGGNAVLVYRHTVFDTADEPLEFAEAVYPPGAWSLEQEYPIEG
ncbi:MAG: GntR family transcriptional regulator [Pseudonocardiales bacterium]|nr:GntR family transcriptional regulator [Pseudonocardiales bacterium]